MEEMNKTFLPRLNDFSELFKEVQKQHVQHIMNLSEQQKLLKENISDIKTELKALTILQKLNDKEAEHFQKYTEIENKIQTFEKHIAAFRVVYQQYINDTNFMLGKISCHWGGYIEQIGVEFILNLLRKEYGVHTWYQKYKRYWHKSKNVELDLVALSDTHAYIIEVKNQLKPEVIQQILISQDKINEHIPELSHLTKQPVVMCVHGDEAILNMLGWANVWVLKYAGFETENQENNWEWIQRPE
ncbi:MAG: hypothetical protein A2046_03670 [Bacteroidetes bacterium GWA2_30_7]|nr:MAG: hypothetical protein A2046_03670 [Bacteroidetes bacterium GWA2_30_7]